MLTSGREFSIEQLKINLVGGPLQSYNFLERKTFFYSNQDKPSFPVRSSPAALPVYWLLNPGPHGHSQWSSCSLVWRCQPAPSPPASWALVAAAAPCLQMYPREHHGLEQSFTRVLRPAVILSPLFSIHGGKGGNLILSLSPSYKDSTLHPGKNSFRKAIWRPGEFQGTQSPLGQSMSVFEVSQLFSVAHQLALLDSCASRCPP